MLMHEALFLAIFVCLVGFFAGVLAVLIIYFLSDYKFHSWPKKLVIDFFSSWYARSVTGAFMC